jgi:hypothetical protein
MNFSEITSVRHESKVTVESTDPHLSNESHPLQLMPLSGASFFRDNGDVFHVSIAAGSGETDAAGFLHLRFSITSASVGRREGSNLAMATPSVESSTGFEERLTIPVSAFAKNEVASGASKSVGVRFAQVSDLHFDAGRLNTAQRVDFSSPPLLNPGALRWRLKAGHTVSVRIVDTGKEQSQARMLFWAGTLGGITASLFFWLGQILLKARRLLPSESEEKGRKHP